MRQVEKGAWPLWTFGLASLLVHFVWLFNLPGAPSASLARDVGEMSSPSPLALAVGMQAQPSPTVAPEPAQAPVAVPVTSEPARPQAAPRPLAEKVEPVAQASRQATPRSVLQPVPQSVHEVRPTSTGQEASDAPASATASATSERAAQALEAIPVAPVVTREPRYAQSPQSPTYPPLARRRGWQGAVWVEIPVSAQGETGRPVLLRSSGFELLDQAALAAAGDWRFVPEYRDGRAVPTRVQIPVEFALR
ncbi:MAG: TonB family protein [Pseudomonas sp.]